MFFKLQSSISLAKLLPNTYYRSYIVYSSASHWDNHPIVSCITNKAPPPQTDFSQELHCLNQFARGAVFFLTTTLNKHNNCSAHAFMSDVRQHHDSIHGKGTIFISHSSC